MAANLSIVDWFTQLDEKQRDLFLNNKENEDYVCPIDPDLMIDPVIAADGFTYERTAIEQHFKTKNTSPMTGLPLANIVLIPNRALKGARDRALQRFKADNPTFSPAETVALVSESSNKAASVIPSDTHSSSSSSSSMAPSTPYDNGSSSSSYDNSSSPYNRLPVAPAPMPLPSYSSSSSSSSVAAPSLDSASSPIARSPEEEQAIQEYARSLGIIRILETSNLGNRKLYEKIRQECDSAIAHIEENFPESRAQVSPQEIEAARLDFCRKIGAIPKNILSLYNILREEYFGLTDEMHISCLTPEAEARLNNLRILQKQLEEDWPEIRYRLLLDQAKGLPLQSLVDDAVSINAVPRRRVIPAPCLVNGPYLVSEKANASIPAQEPSSVRTSLHNLKSSFKARFFSEAALQISAPVKSFNYDSYDYLFKILLVGDSGAGKSCLILRYTDNTYTPMPISTIGVDFKIKSIALNEATVKLQIWDKQKRFRPENFNVYRDIHAIIVAFDVTNRESFDNVHNYLQEIDKYANENIIVTLVATKCDAPKAAWKVSEEEIQLLAEQTRKDVFFTSAKAEENGFVDRLFEGVAKSLVSDKIEMAPSGPSSLSRR